MAKKSKNKTLKKEQLKKVRGGILVAPNAPTLAQSPTAPSTTLNKLR